MPEEALRGALRIVLVSPKRHDVSSCSFLRGRRRALDHMGFLDRLFGSKATPPKVPSAGPKPVAPKQKQDWEDAGAVPQELAASEVALLYASPERPVFLDVREDHERVANGFIPGSLHIPMHEIQGRTDELNPAEPLVVYCASGMRSMDVGAFLLQQGFKSVSNLNGGLSAWRGPLDHPGRGGAQ
jgi:rhodanese-related sulfurtransferase